MGLFSFLQRKKTPVPETRKRTPPPQDPANVEALRTRARRRLIGAAVLVSGAVVGLPTLFDQPPRPVAQSFKVRMAAADGTTSVSAQSPATAASAALVRQGHVEMAPPSLGASSTAVVAAAAGTAAVVGMLPGTGKKPQVEDTIITETKADAEADRLRAEKAKAERVRADKLKADKIREAREAEQAREAEKAEKARQERLAKKAREAKAAREAEEAREAAAARKAKAAREAKDAREAKEAKAAKDAKVAKPGSDGDKATRYVIQVGSFADTSAARDLGRRIDKLGLDSHEQRVVTASGAARTRVRLGPFNSKEEALRAAARLKAAGLHAAVLPL